MGILEFSSVAVDVGIWYFSSVGNWVPMATHSTVFRDDDEEDKRITVCTYKSHKLWKCQNCLYIWIESVLPLGERGFIFFLERFLLGTHLPWGISYETNGWNQSSVYLFIACSLDKDPMMPMAAKLLRFLHRFWKLGCCMINAAIIWLFWRLWQVSWQPILVNLVNIARIISVMKISINVVTYKDIS